MHQASPTPLVDAGYRLAAAITKREAKSFYFASHFLPRREKEAAFTIYALCRLGDEAVDEHYGQKAADDLRQITLLIDAAYSNAPADPLPAALKETVERCALPRRHFDAFIAGMRMDIDIHRYENFARLSEYCYGAAGVVGLAMLRVFGAEGKEAEQPAMALGYAMQLTNIVRDIKEDYARGRIYLPRDEMARYGVSEEDIASCRMTEGFRELLKFQIQRARSYYAQARAGIRLIPDPRCRLVVAAMSTLYEGILDAIERQGYDVFSRRAYVSGIEKIWRVLPLLLKGKAR